MSLTTTLELRAIDGNYRLVGLDSIIGFPYLIKDFKILEKAEFRAKQELDTDKTINMTEHSTYFIYDRKGNLISRLYL